MAIQLLPVAYGIVDGATGNLTAGRGVTSNRSGAGEYSLSLPNGTELDNSEVSLNVSLVDNAGSVAWDVSNSDDKEKAIVSFNAGGVAADQSFSFQIWLLKII